MRLGVNAVSIEGTHPPHNVADQENVEMPSNELLGTDLNDHLAG